MRGVDYIDVGPDNREHPHASVSMNSNKHDASSSSLRPLDLRSVRDRIISCYELLFIFICTHYFVRVALFVTHVRVILIIAY